MTEFTGFDVEFAWCFETADIMKLEEEILTYAFSKLEPFKERVMELYGIELMTQPTVQYLTLAEAKAILADELKLSTGQDLPDEGERLLYEKLGKDLIFKGIEITTGAIREHRIDILEQQALEKGIQPESIHHYLDNFRYGCPPHGGFGLGLERVIMKLLGLSSVKEVSFVPRDPDRLTP